MALGTRLSDPDRPGPTRRGCLALLILLLPASVSAHPLGNFTINRYTALEVRGSKERVAEPAAVVVQYAVDMAELPAFKEMRVLDRNGNGTIEPEERDAYLALMADQLGRGLELTVDGAPLALAPGPRTLEIAPGAGGMPTLRLDFSFVALLRGPSGRLEFHDRNFAGRAGWQEVIARGADGVALSDATVPATDRSQALRAYPEDLLQAPLAVSEVRLAFAPGTVTTPASVATAPAGARARANRFGDRLTALIANPSPLGPWVIATSLLIAMLLGAMHALTPGHGKTIVGAYLVGARGTARHALVLGLVVTITHTLGVYALGLLALTASHYFVPEQLFPWLSALSGAMVVAIGASLTGSRLKTLLAGQVHASHHHHGPEDHDHAHDHGPHSHDHEHLPTTPVTPRSLIALGVSGGLLPCPSALVVMLGAIALGRIPFGLVLIVAFSVGLATVLTGIGLVLVHARRLFERLPLDGRFARYLPVASALVISLAGLAILAEALLKIRV